MSWFVKETAARRSTESRLVQGELSLPETPGVSPATFVRSLPYSVQLTETIDYLEAKRKA